MDVVFEIIFEFFAELFCEGLTSVFTDEFVPYEELPRKKREKYKFIVFVVSVVMFVSLIVGGIILLETKGESELGIILVGFPIVYILTAVVLLIRKSVKRRKKK